MARTPGRLKQSVAESSFDAWTRYYKQDENSPNALVSYYTKGSLVALGLDLLIRQETAGARSLDDVMRLLWQRHGRDFYQGRPQGLAEDGLPALIREATGVDARRFIARYAYGTADVPLAKLLEPQGIRLQWKTAANIPTLEVRTRKQGDTLALATVLEGGAGHKGGLSAGDVLVAIDGLRVDAPAGLELLLAQYRPGDRVTIHVFRRDELRAFRVRLGAPQALDCVLSESLARAALRGGLQETVQRAAASCRRVTAYTMACDSAAGSAHTAMRPSIWRQADSGASATPSPAATSASWAGTSATLCATSGMKPSRAQASASQRA